MAWLARERSNPSYIASVRDDTGTLQSDPLQINAQFAKYYESLYTSKVDFTPDKLKAFLSARSRLDTPIMVKEVQLAVASLQTAKTQVQTGYQWNSTKLTMSFSFLTFNIAVDAGGGLSSILHVRGGYGVVPKPSKDPELCASYRLKLLLNVDAKVVTKILANCLSSVILSLILDQTGFMPGKGTTSIYVTFTLTFLR